MTLRFEAATSKDLPQLVELLGQLFEQEAEFTPNAAKQEAALKLIFANPSYGKLFVAKDGSRVVAMARSRSRTAPATRAGSAGWRT